MRVFGLLFTFQGAFSIDSVMSRFSYVTLHYHLFYDEVKDLPLIKLSARTIL